MGYWDQTVNDERECGGCGYTVKMTRREHYSLYGYEPGGRNRSYTGNDDDEDSYYEVAGRRYSK